MSQESNQKEIPDWKREIGVRHEEFYTSKGLTRTDFSKVVQESYERIRSYDRGISTPSAEYLSKVKKLYPDLDIGYILTGERTLNPGIQPVTKEEMRYKIPVVNEVTAGTMKFNFADEDIIGYVYTKNLKDKDLFALRVKGNSMNPEISPGDIVICAPHRAFVSGLIYVVISKDSEATLKRVYRKSGGYELIAENPEYRSVYVPDDRLEKMYRVLEVRKDYDGLAFEAN